MLLALARLRTSCKIHATTEGLVADIDQVIIEVSSGEYALHHL